MRTLAIAAAGLILATGCSSLQRAATGATARAELRNAQGQVVGVATLTEVTGGVRLVLDVRDLPPGPKGVHVHEVGQCTPPTFASAGAHFNPMGRRHGIMNPEGPHGGDLPNIAVDAKGLGHLETTSDRISLGMATSTLDEADGSAIVVHAKPDDHVTDPSGDSGDRIACGVIVKPRS